MINYRTQSVENTARDREILRRRQNGESCRPIATDMNLSRERVRQIAKRGLTPSQRAGRPRTRPKTKELTPREREVALLVRRNLSNDEIARELGIKRGTVAIHIHNILIKRGLSPRPRRSSKRVITDAGLERIREAQRRRWQRWRAKRSEEAEGCG